MALPPGSGVARTLPTGFHRFPPEGGGPWHLNQLGVIRTWLPDADSAFDNGVHIQDAGIWKESCGVFVFIEDVREITRRERISPGVRSVRRHPSVKVLRSLSPDRFSNGRTTSDLNLTRL